MMKRAGRPENRRPRELRSQGEYAAAVVMKSLLTYSLGTNRDVLDSKNDSVLCEQCLNMTTNPDRLSELFSRQGLLYSWHWDYRACRLCSVISASSIIRIRSSPGDDYLYSEIGESPTSRAHSSPGDDYLYSGIDESPIIRAHSSPGDDYMSQKRESTGQFSALNQILHSTDQRLPVFELESLSFLDKDESSRLKVLVFTTEGGRHAAKWNTVLIEHQMTYPHLV